MPNIKIINISKDINVGVGTIKDFLENKGVEDVKGPNSRISTEYAVECVNELGKSLSGDEKKALINKYSQTKGDKKPTPSPAKSEPTPVKDEKKEERLVKTEVPEAYKPNLQTKGYIDLDNLGKKPKQKDSDKNKVTKANAEKPLPKKNVGKKDSEFSKAHEHNNEHKTKIEPTKGESKQNLTESDLVNNVSKVEKPESKISMQESVNATNSAPNDKKVVEEVLDKKLDRSKDEKQLPKDNDTHQDEKKPLKTDVADTKMEKGTPTEDIPVDTATKIMSSADINETGEVFRFEHEDQNKPELKILGKLDLSTVDTSTTASKKRRRKDADGEKKKRKRINKQKVNISEAAESKDVGKGKNASNNRRSGKKKVDAQPKVGRKQKRAAAKKEVSQEEIQKQIKETLQQMQNQKRKGSTAAKYRKDKREAHRREHDEQERASGENNTLRLTEYVTANDLATMMDLAVNDIISFCFNLGIMVSINQRLDKETIDLILEEYGYVPEYVGAEVVEAITEIEEDKEEDLLPRAPIVTVMGHVDHGKTSLLDNIRKTNVIAGEAGGITQHVGAYSVTVANDKKITFLDTPGHEAFTAMRARGAKVTDIVIVIIAADDGVKPQTIEAINHASVAGVPIIFAINKIDRPDANPDKIKEQLSNLNYLVEDWGGKYQSQNISAKSNIGIEDLLEKVLLEAEMLDLKANPNKKAIGTVIESTLEHGRGYTTKVLVREGTLHVGDTILSGIYHGRVKALFNERGQTVDEVGPATPVKVLGLNGAAQAGDTFNVLDSEQEAREIASKREQLQREQKERMHKIPTLQSLGDRIKEGQIQELNVIVKGDVDGSVEALSGSIEKLSTDQVHVRVIHKAVGQISDSDVVLAAASDAVIIGFQVRPSGSAKKIAENEGVEIRTYSVIYTALDEVKAAMEGMLSPEIEEHVVANLEVRETFRISKVGTIAGCVVKEGKINRNNKVRLIRDGIVIYSGNLASLKRFKDDVKEVGNGYECGLNLENFNDIQEGDIIEAYEEVEVKKKL